MDSSQSIGLVDLETLVKMYEQLLQSHQEEDNELAVFIRMDYLPIGFDENTKGGVPIQGKESFTKLYNAYKRVRNLTGRVQDKWPFFDRKLKAINKNVAIKIAAGEDNSTLFGAPDRSSSDPPSGDDMAGDNPATIVATTAQSKPSVPFTGAETIETTQYNGTAAEDMEMAQALPTSTERTSPSPSAPAADGAPSVAPSHSAETERTADDMSVQSTPSSLLAVEAEPKHTDLDDLPTSPGRKRKVSPDFDNNGRFATGHRGHNKRSRGGVKGGRGGRGRGRKKGPLGAEHDDPKNDVEDHTPSTLQGAGVAEKPNASPPSPRVTRQQKRLSGGSDTQITLSHDSRAVSQKPDSRKGRADSDDTAIGEQAITRPSKLGGAAIPESDSTRTELTAADLVDYGISHFGIPQPSSAMSSKVVYRAKTSESTAPTNEQEDKSDTGSQEPNTVQIIARVRTENAAHDIVLPESVIKDKELHNLLFRYASWKEKMGEKANSIDFEMWRNIYTY
ncbi:hypothetical protein GRF29_1g2305077 [Pseudopithomyces chartarum]|uniref:Uncharacterized protein n=1 Tax=Pseudopithomyces chartarum TaxID=1892770 RepID=A0AAN6M9H3_9PLEO|nr:hypothetical protein GRF29_1g2305077 [Pseudopithomyces chartarum]